MGDKIIDTLAVQVANFYKGGGRYVLYGSVYPRGFKEGSDPALSYLKVTTAAINIFDSESNTGVVAYLDPVDPAYVLEKIKSFMGSSNDEPAGNESYNTTRMLFGAYKGKTVAEFVASAPEEEVKREYSSLKANVGQYPANNKIVAAIYDAVLAKKDGKLAYAKESQVTVIDEVKTPNNKNLDSRGLTECRTIKITYTKGQDNPYTIEIQNFMAPPANGLIGAKFSQAQDMKKLSMSLSEKEMFTLFDEFVKAKEMYARATEGKRIQYADSKAWKPESSTVIRPNS